MAATVMFLHGPWVTSSFWEKFREFFEDRGVATIAPGWPGKSRTVEEIAFALGFSDAANFRHAFRRWTNAAPRQGS